MSHYTPVQDNLHYDVSENDCVIKANEPQVLEDLAVLPSTSEFLEEQKYDQSRQLILATEAGNLSSSFFEKAMDACAPDTHRYLNYCRLSFRIISVAGSVPWHTSTGLYNILA